MSIALLALGALGAGGCSMSRPAETGSPAAAARANNSRYPVRLVNSPDRSERATATWLRLSQPTGGNNGTGGAALATPALRPVTATIEALPAGGALSLRLPRVGDPDQLAMNDDELRESLRRFLANSAELLAADANQISLISIDRGESANDVRIARYEQRPFLYPLRNGYGAIEVGFTPDGRVTSLSSTAVPTDEQLRRAVNNLKSRLTPEEIVANLLNNTYTLAAAAALPPSGNSTATATVTAGPPVTITVAAREQAEFRELVIYPLLRADDPSVLEFHLARQIDVKNPAGGDAVVGQLYVDAVNGEVLNAAPAGGTS